MDPRERLLFFSRLGALLEAGVELGRALDILSKRASGLAGRHAIERLLEKVREGIGLSEALEGSYGDFSALDARITAAGEAGGRLPMALGALSASLERAHRYRLKIRADNVYYALLTGLALALVIFFNVISYNLNVMLSEAYQSVYYEGGVMTKFDRSDVIVNVFAFMVPTLIAGVPVVFLLIRLRAPEFWSRLLLFIPWLDRRSVLADQASFARSMALAVNSGLSIPESVTVAATSVENSELRNSILAMRGDLLEGADLSTVIGDVIGLPGHIHDMVAIAEGTGGLAEAFAESAESLEADLEGKGNPWLVLVPVLLLLFLFVVSYAKNMAHFGSIFGMAG